MSNENIGAHLGIYLDQQSALGQVELSFNSHTLGLT